MPYPRNLLNDNETVALDLNPHWWFLLKPAVTLVAAIVLGIVALTVPDDGDFRTVAIWVSLALIVAAAVWLVISYLRWSTTNFVITSDRVIFREGVVGKSGIEIPLERVNTVHSHQSVFERFLKAGDLLIESAGETGQQRFTDIKNPSRVQNLIHAQREANNHRMYGGGSNTVDVATQIEKLEALRDRGTITADEFEQQKRRLLDG